MSEDHPGVIAYHVDYPEPGVSEWVEIYANKDVFRAHLANEKVQAPLGEIIGVCDKITCRCWGDPDAASKDILAGFGAGVPRDRGRSVIREPGGRPDLSDLKMLVRALPRVGEVLTEAT